MNGIEELQREKRYNADKYEDGVGNDKEQTERNESTRERMEYSGVFVCNFKQSYTVTGDNESSRQHILIKYPPKPE